MGDGRRAAIASAGDVPAYREVHPGVLALSDRKSSWSPGPGERAVELTRLQVHQLVDLEPISFLPFILCLLFLGTFVGFIFVSLILVFGSPASFGIRGWLILFTGATLPVLLMITEIYSILFRLQAKRARGDGAFWLLVDGGGRLHVEIDHCGGGWRWAQRWYLGARPDAVGIRVVHEEDGACSIALEVPRPRGERAGPPTLWACTGWDPLYLEAMARLLARHLGIPCLETRERSAVPDRTSATVTRTCIPRLASTSAGSCQGIGRIMGGVTSPRGAGLRGSGSLDSSG